MTRRLAEPCAAELWLVDLATAGAALDEMEADQPRLAAEDEARFAAMRDATTRRDRRLSHIALRLCLERSAGPAARSVPYVVASSGKPALPSLGVSFSLSHSKGVALIGLARGVDIGVDIERARPVRVMGERRAAIERAGIELARGLALPEAIEPRFLTAWVRLESVAKAEGSGVGAHLSVFMGRRPKLKPRRGPGARDAGPLLARDVALGPGLYAAVALPEAIATPKVNRLPSDRAGLSAFLSS